MYLVVLLSLLVVVDIIYGQQTPNEVSFNPIAALNWDILNVTDQIDLEFHTVVGTQTGLEFRDLAGFLNNPLNDFGSIFALTNRRVPAAYSDGFNSLAGDTRENAREISNVIGKQDEDDTSFINERDLTQFTWQWGQFVDHDITLISEFDDELDFDDDIDIYVPCGDPNFDPLDTCDADIFIGMFRTRALTAPSETNIRNQFNEITSFLDGSGVYGVDFPRASFLRDDTDIIGGMAVDDTNFLPKQPGAGSGGGEEDGSFPNAPNTDTNYFLAGDVRANEQLGLLTMHTIFVRLHNEIAGELQSNAAFLGSDGTPDSDSIYEYTKLIVTAIIQKITYHDWLPTLFGPAEIALFLPEYSGYDSSVNPNIDVIFTSAAYRYGHSQLPAVLPLRTDDCSAATFPLCTECDDAGFISLRDAFFVPQIAEDNDGLMEAILNGFVCTLANKIDVAVTDDVRNFLFTSAVESDGVTPLFGVLDLLAINLQRGREHGIADYNTVRTELGFDALTDFDELSSDPVLNDNFRVLYEENINDIDLFLGGLAEDHLDDSSFGETFSNIILTQFQRIRDGDRFWYQNYIEPGELMDFINCMTLKSVIEITTEGIGNIDTVDLNSNIFRNSRAIPVFDGAETFEAKSPGINDIADAEIVHNHYYHENNPPKKSPQAPFHENNPYKKAPQAPQAPYHENNPYKQPQEPGTGGNDNNNYYPEKPVSDTYVIELTNFQIFLLFAVVITVIGCTCFTFIQFNKMKNKNRYKPVKYVDSETDQDASDRERLQS